MPQLVHQLHEISLMLNALLLPPSFCMLFPLPKMPYPPPTSITEFFFLLKLHLSLNRTSLWKVISDLCPPLYTQNVYVLTFYPSSTYTSMTQSGFKTASFDYKPSTFSTILNCLIGFTYSIPKHFSTETSFCWRVII